MIDYLDVYLHEKKVGVLASDKGRMAFTYSPEYLNQPDAEPLAYTLPLSAEPYSGGTDTASINKKNPGTVPFF